MAAFPITSADVQGYLGTAPTSEADQGSMTNAALAASGWVADRVLGVATMPTEVTDTVHLGTIMLAARWYNRRASINGIAAFSELGGAYVMREDPDVAKLLGLGKPGVG